MITAFASLALMFAAAPAATDPVAVDPYIALVRVKVSYRDLNLNTAAGRTELDRRLARAVRTACPAPDHRQLSEIQANAACLSVANASADRQRTIALESAGKADPIGSSGR